MATIESNQVTLRLTQDPEVLQQLRRNKRFATNSQGKEELILSFDSQPFSFSLDGQLTVGETVARALMRSSEVIVGDPLTGDVRPALVNVRRFGVGDSTAVLNQCPYCQDSFEKPTQLAAHLFQRRCLKMSQFEPGNSGDANAGKTVPGVTPAV